MATVYIRFPARPADPSMRAPLLERLLARAGSPSPVLDWRAEAFAVIAAPGATPVMAPAPAAAALCAAALCAANPSRGGAWVCVATPVHLSAGMTQVTLPVEGVLRLDLALATVLAASFNEMFQSAGARLDVGRDAVLLCVFDRVLDVHAHDPDDVLGRDVFDHQPSGPDSTRIRGLMSEIEMWLFEHVINLDRTARGLPVISGLWLWGGGPVIEALPAVSGWTAGLDPLFAAFGNVSGYPKVSSASRAAAVVGAPVVMRTGGMLGAGVVVCADVPGSPAWAEFETRWLAPVAASLRSGRVQRVELSAGARRFSISGRWPWRFWRRPRPWWHGVEDEGSE